MWHDEWHTTYLWFSTECEVSLLSYWWQAIRSVCVCVCVCVCVHKTSHHPTNAMHTCTATGSRGLQWPRSPMIWAQKSRLCNELNAYKSQCRCTSLYSRMCSPCEFCMHGTWVLPLEVFSCAPPSCCFSFVSDITWSHTKMTKQNSPVSNSCKLLCWTPWAPRWAVGWSQRHAHINVDWLDDGDTPPVMAELVVAALKETGKGQLSPGTPWETCSIADRKVWQSSTFNLHRLPQY